MSEKTPGGSGNRIRLSDRLALSIPEAAAALGVSERHLRELLPEIPHVHLRGRVVIPVRGMEEWLRDQAKAERNRAETIADEVLKTMGERHDDQ